MNSFFKQSLLFIGMFLFSLSSMAQNKMTVTGKIVDESGEALPGVAVIVSGTSSATVSDLDGLYSISAAAGNTLEFTCLGYETKSVVVAQ